MAAKISWDCPRCRLMNPLSYKNCWRCFEPRPKDADPRREPDPPPKPEVPTPPPPPKTQPEAPKTPKPDIPTDTSTKPEPSKPAWKKTCLQLAAAFGAGAVVGKLFLPGWVVLVLEAIKQILTAIGGS